MLGLDASTFFSKKVLALTGKLAEKVSCSLNVILLNGIFFSKEATRRTIAYRSVAFFVVYFFAKF